MGDVVRVLLANLGFPHSNQPLARTRARRFWNAWRKSGLVANFSARALMGEGAFASAQWGWNPQRAGISTETTGPVWPSLAAMSAMSVPGAML